MESIGQQVFVLIIAIVLSIVTVLIAWKARFFRIPKQVIHSTPVLSLRHLVFAFLIFITVPLLMSILLSLYFYEKTGEIASISITTEGWFTVASIVVSVFCIEFYAYVLGPEVRKTLWGGRLEGVKHWIKDFVLGVLTWMMAMPITIVVGQILSILILLEFKGPHIDQDAVKHLKMTEESPLLFIVMSILVGSLIPIMEETLFRGLVQTWLRERMNRTYAILITASIFSLFHITYSQGIANLEIVASLFTLSCFLGYLYERQHSLWAPIGLHMTFNTVTIMLIKLST